MGRPREMARASKKSWLNTRTFMQLECGFSTISVILCLRRQILPGDIRGSQRLCPSNLGLLHLMVDIHPHTQLYLVMRVMQHVCIKRRVILVKYSASFILLKTQNINKNHFILCSSINKRWGKTLLSTQQSRGTPWESGVMSGENHQKTAHILNCLNRGALLPSPPLLRWGASPPTPLFS